MNNTILSTALLTVLSTSAYADATTTPPAAAPAKATATGPVATPVATQPSVALTPPPAEQAVNCKYRIPADTTTIEQSLITAWAGKAATQSFNFNPATVDNELTELKDCYTDQGWQGFNDALQKSGNIAAIKSQHLTVSSQVDGDIKFNAIKDNQWKVTVPLQVVYQNDKEKLTQLLSIDLLVGRKMSGDLGVMQMIATPRSTESPQQPEAQPTTPAQAVEQAPAAKAPAKPAAGGTQAPAHP